MQTCGRYLGTSSSTLDRAQDLSRGRTAERRNGPAHSRLSPNARGSALPPAPLVSQRRRQRHPRKPERRHRDPRPSRSLARENTNTRESSSRRWKTSKRARHALQYSAYAHARSTSSRTTCGTAPFCVVRAVTKRACFPLPEMRRRRSALTDTRVVVGCPRHVEGARSATMRWRTTPPSRRSSSSGYASRIQRARPSTYPSRTNV